MRTRFNRHLRRQAFTRVWALACGFVWCCAAAAPAFATQRLVTPGDDWQLLAPKIKPGDDIILMPGRHRPALFESLIGTEEHPITIRGADPAQPATIEAEYEGLRIKHASHLILKDFAISGASLNGLCLGEQKTTKPAVSKNPPQTTAPVTVPTAVDASPADGPVLIHNLTIKKTGPRGQRHAIVIAGFDDVRIDECHIEGWGGSAIELISCHGVAIEQCNITGMKDHSQLQGIEARGASDRVTIQNCQLQNAGERVISAGCVSEPNDCRPPMPADAAPGSFAEATRIQVERCVIIGGQCTFAFIHADDCTVRNNTVVRPRYCVIGISAPQKDVRLTTGRRNVFGGNLIIWQPGDLTRLADFKPTLGDDAFVLEENLWWSDENAEQRKKLGPLPGRSPATQLTEIDPKLDEALKPTERSAKAFGY